MPCPGRTTVPAFGRQAMPTRGAEPGAERPDDGIRQRAGERAVRSGDHTNGVGEPRRGVERREPVVGLRKTARSTS